MLLTSLCWGRRTRIACRMPVAPEVSDLSRILVAELCYYAQKDDGGHEKWPYNGHVSNQQFYTIDKAVSRLSLRLRQGPGHEQTGLKPVSCARQGLARG